MYCIHVIISKCIFPAQFYHKTWRSINCPNVSKRGYKAITSNRHIDFYVPKKDIKTARNIEHFKILTSEQSRKRNKENIFIIIIIYFLCCDFQADRHPPFVKVSRADVDQLVTEIMQVKEFLPKVTLFLAFLSNLKSSNPLPLQFRNCKSHGFRILLDLKFFSSLFFNCLSW